MILLKSLIFFIIYPSLCLSWIVSPTTTILRNAKLIIVQPDVSRLCASLKEDEQQPAEEYVEEEEITLDSLMDMDIVIFSRRRRDSTTSGDGDQQRELGAMQEDGTLAPLSTWSEDVVFGDMMEFLVDEEDRWTIPEDDVIIHSLLPEDLISYGSRQVGGGKGPGNPHGEESETLYYIDRALLDEGGSHPIKVVLKPELEITW